MSTEEPPAPQGASLVFDDGYTTPLEFVYEGTNREGFAVWRATVTLQKRILATASLRCDVLPAKCAIYIPVFEGGC